MSLGTLATELGVSRRTISKYEEGGMDASIDVVLHLEELLDVALAKSIDILQAFEKRLREPPMPLEEKKYPEEDNVSICCIPWAIRWFRHLSAL
jgi:putative transcriptional regulator